jgi:hypothetical protein
VKGNPHITWAESAFGAARAEADPTFNRDVRQDAQIQAILALAYEQRTANLIDLMQTDSFEDHDGRWGILNSLRADIFSQIIERLGL